MRYLARRGFNVPEPQDVSRLFSASYWLETRPLAKKLRRDLSLAAVGDSYRRAFAGLMVSRSPVV